MASAVTSADPARADPRDRGRAVRGARLPRGVGRRHRRGLRDLRAGALQALRRPRTRCSPRCWSRSASGCSRSAASGAAAAARRAGRAVRRWSTGTSTSRCGDRPLIVVQDRDWESLPDEAREQVRTPAAGVRRPLGRRAPRGCTPAALGPRPGDGARGVRPDQLHPAQRPCSPTRGCASCSPQMALRRARDRRRLTQMRGRVVAAPRRSRLSSGSRRWRDATAIVVRVTIGPELRPDAEVNDPLHLGIPLVAPGLHRRGAPGARLRRHRRRR